MPVLFRARGFRFFFHANEGNPTEPAHVHVEKDDLEAKFWITPDVRVPLMMASMPGLCGHCCNWWMQTGIAWKGPGMTSSVRATSVSFDRDNMWVSLSDGRTLGVPLAWFPRLMRGTREQREACRISSRGLHWEALDEDISVAGLLAGLGDQTRPMPAAAQ
jgi:hypothetical protein